jgi:hypothetical protein
MWENAIACLGHFHVSDVVVLFQTTTVSDVVIHDNYSLRIFPSEPSEVSADTLKEAIVRESDAD